MAKEPFKYPQEHYVALGEFVNKYTPLLSVRFPPKNNTLARMVAIENNHSQSILVLTDSGTSYEYAKSIHAQLKNPFIRLDTKRSSDLHDSEFIQTIVTNLLGNRTYSDVLLKGVSLQRIYEEVCKVDAQECFKNKFNLDCKVISYFGYETRSIHNRMPIDTLGFGKPQKSHKVLITHGAYWDIRHAVELLPKAILEQTVWMCRQQNIEDYKIDSEQPRGYHCTIIKQTNTLNENLKYHLAQHLVLNGSFQQQPDKEQIAKRYELYEKIQNDYLHYNLMCQRFFEKEYGYFENSVTEIEVIEYIKVLDSMRPDLRHAGIYDIEEILEHEELIQEAIKYVLEMKNAKIDRKVAIVASLNILRSKIYRKDKEDKKTTQPANVHIKNDVIYEGIHKFNAQSAALWASHTNRDKFGQEDLYLYVLPQGYPTIGPIDLYRENQYSMRAALNEENTVSMEQLEQALESSVFLKSSLAEISDIRDITFAKNTIGRGTRT